MELSGFLLGIVTGIILASGFFGLNWKYFKSKLEEQQPTGKQDLRVTVMVTVVEDSNTAYPVGYSFELPISWERMVEVAKRVLQNSTFNYSLTGRESGNPLTRSEFDKLRDVLMKHGILHEKVPGNRKSGLGISRPGRVFFEKWAELPTLSDVELAEMYKNQRSAHGHTDAN